MSEDLRSIERDGISLKEAIEKHIIPLEDSGSTIVETGNGIRKWCDLEALADPSDEVTRQWLNPEQRLRALWERVRAGEFHVLGRIDSPISPPTKLEIFEFEAYLFHVSDSRITLKPKGPVIHRVRLIATKLHDLQDRAIKRAAWKLAKRLESEPGAIESLAPHGAFRKYAKARATELGVNWETFEKALRGALGSKPKRTGKAG